MIALAAGVLLAGGCKGHRLYHAQPAEYLQRLEAADPEGAGAGAPAADLSVIEFDDQGVFWEPAQLAAAVENVRERSAASPGGVRVVLFVNSWQNDADPCRDVGDLHKFKKRLSLMAARYARPEAGGGEPSRVVGVYLGWRGRTALGPGFRSTSFWNRRRAALRVAHGSVREAVLEVLTAAAVNPRSKAYVAGHSMGGMIVAQALGPSLTTLLLTSGPGGVKLPTDVVVLLNPALDALSSWRLVTLLKRTEARVELRGPGGVLAREPGPLAASITSEADAVLDIAFPIGTGVEHLTHSFRGRIGPQGMPKQRYLATHAEGKVDALVSHRAWVDDGGRVRLERLRGAWNDTPYWVIRVTEEISSGHSDTDNPRINELLDRISALNGLHETEVEPWLLRGPEPAGGDAP